MKTRSDARRAAGFRSLIQIRPELFTASSRLKDRRETKVGDTERVIWLPVVFVSRTGLPGDNEDVM